MLGLNQIKVGMPFCKFGSVTGETCGAVKGTEGNYAVETSVYSLPGDSGSPGFVKNADGTVSAVGVLVQPLLGKWGLQVLP